MTKDRSIFENRFLRKLHSRNVDKIIGFLENKGNVGYCDDCLSTELGITPRQQVNQICRRLQNEGRIIRERGICAICMRHKILNFLVNKPKKIKISQQALGTMSLTDEEEWIREAVSKFLGIRLMKEKLWIFGKEKEFDLVNIDARIVGDIKSYRYSGDMPSAEFSALCEYVWLMEKLEESSGSKWRKIIVGSGNVEIYERYARKYHPWLGDVEIYFINDKGKIKKIRDAIKLYI